MAADVGRHGGGVLFGVGAPEGVETVMEALVGEDEAVGDVDELARVVLRKERGQLGVGEGVDVRDLCQIGRDVVVGAGFVKRREREPVDLAVERRVVLGDDAHRLEPVRAGGLDVEDAARLASDAGEDGELVGAGVDGDLVAEVAGDLRVDVHLAFELGEVAHVVDALLELAAEAGRHRRDLHTAAGQLVCDEEMLQGRRRRRRFVDGDLEIGAVFAGGEELVPDGDREVDRLAVDVDDLCKLVRGEGDGLAFADVEGLPEVARLAFGADGAAAVAADVLGAVEGDHREAEGERIGDVLGLFEMVAVRAEAALEALAVDGEGGRVEDVLVGAVGEVQLADALLAEDGQGVVFFKDADVAGTRDAQTVADADGAGRGEHRHGRGEGEGAAQKLRRGMVAGGDGDAAAGLAGHLALADADEDVRVPRVRHEEGRAVQRADGFRINAVFVEIDAAAGDKGLVIHRKTKPPCYNEDIFAYIITGSGQDCKVYFSAAAASAVSARYAPSVLSEQNGMPYHWGALSNS